MIRLLLLLLLPICAAAEGRLEDPRRWGLATVNPHGNRFEIDYANPAVHRWWSAPSARNIYATLGESDTRYAVQYYERYVNNLLEGSDFYDTFGTHLGRGWMVYNWSQEQPLPRGSRIDKDMGETPISVSLAVSWSLAIVGRVATTV